MEKIFNEFKYTNNTNVTGLTNELNIFYMLNYFNEKKEDVIIVVNSLFEATKLYNSFQTYTDDVLLFPMDDFLTSVMAVKSPELKFTRLETLKKLNQKRNKIVITNLVGYLKKLPNPETKQDTFVKVGTEINRTNFINELESLGYTRESLVTSTSEYCVRGMLIDIFPIYGTNPIRIELDGNLIESIKYFDSDTQISNKEIIEVNISATNEVDGCESFSLLNYVTDQNVFFIESEQLEAANKKLSEDIFEYSNKIGKSIELYNDFDLCIPKNSININSFGSNRDIAYSSKELENYNENFDKLVLDYKNWIKNGYEVCFYLSLKSEILKIKALIPEVKIINKKINKGFIFNKNVVISEYDIEKKVIKQQEYKGNFKFGKKIKSYDSLEIGDFVVHINNGVGVYKGIRKLSKNGLEKDFLQIDYANNDKIYVPASKITTIYKYTDKDGSKPKLSSLNSQNWKKTRKYIESKIKDISAELINLYKKRLEIKSEKYMPYLEENKIFDDSFDFSLTQDQSRSINDILSDLRSGHPMDRLLCGDVGFGKTEVALKTMFNSVLNNKQVLYLCPTTILSTQQCKVAIERFKDWPIEIALLNRFTSLKEAKIILERFKKGSIDILFGTHRILSDDVKAQKLGLLVVDEEQRFGVVHKEKIKNLKNDVNVLTLSATPIPRTLKMALSGVRDMSVITTAPVNRYPIQTYVLGEDEFVIKDAIYKELSRGGQVFILHNRVDDIDSVTKKISSLVPDARVNFAHGKMDKTKLENIMNSFISHEFDILICTTIIESGIDIPNVNTLLVMDADKFGLSQLYQIRGRVGRSDKIGYAYLFYEKQKVLNETAIKRLKAIKDFTELGSGYKIAMRDLAIRGAGDIFGASQAGFIDSVGITLYLKMIDNEMKRERGEEVEEINEISLIDVETHINDDYVSDEDIKIEIHTLINSVDSENKFNEVADELINRFGKLPENLVIYMYEEWFEKLAKKLEIKDVIKTDRFIEITIPSHISKNIKGDKLLMTAYQINTKFNLKYTSGQIKISLFYKGGKNHFLIDYVKLLDEILLYNLNE